MSRAEDLAEKAYPYPAWSNETTRAIDDLRRNAFIEGYHQAEKDLALTWKDIKLIWNITDEMDNMPEEKFYQEVLKRFDKQKGKRNDIKRH